MKPSRANGRPLFRVALHPTVGPAPRPPKALGEALSLLDAPIAVQMHALAANPAAQAGDPMISALNGLFDLGEELRDLSDMFGDFGGSWMANALSHSLGAIPVVKRARARGLTVDEMTQWTDAARVLLTQEERAGLAAYAQSCMPWEQRLTKNIGSMAADPDWDMGSAPRVPASAPEAFLARSLEEIGIPMHAQVGVSRYGGRRQGGWFRAFWLDCAHRDVAFLLRLDVELDGAAHRIRERGVRDAVRNTLLRERGWYVLRVDSRNLGREEHYRARDVVAALVRRHRRAVVLARSDLPSLTRMLVPQDVTSQSELDGGSA